MSSRRDKRKQKKKKKREMEVKRKLLRKRSLLREEARIDREINKIKSLADEKLKPYRKPQDETKHSVSD
jgi:hypothetical protein